ncbi:MAG: hypothetical protein HY815_09565 [Candidatus Riflebacteria bacterium]|nr:hypothetical protein [Candidatus Riflebacteria bacterium]
MNRRGLSFTEVLVALIVIVVGVLPMISVFLSTGDSIRQTFPYYQAIFLAELAAEESRLGASEDPHYVDRFTQESYCRLRTTVLRGNHPYLAVVEDSATPFGRMQKGKDAALGPGLGAIYPLVEPLGLFVAPEFGTAPDSGLEEIRFKTRFDWLDKRKRPMEFLFPTNVVSWHALDRVETVAPAATGGTGKLASFNTLMALGQSAKALVDAVKVKVAALDPATQTGGAYSRAVALLSQATLNEAVAAELLGILQDMHPAVQDLAAGVSRDQLPVPKDKRRLAVTLLGKTLQGLNDCLAGSIGKSGQAGAAPSLPIGVYLGAHRRVVRCAKMDLLTRPWPNSGSLATMLRDVAAFYQDRMPNPWHAFSIEERDLSDLNASYPLVAAARKVRFIREHFSQAAFQILLCDSEDKP